MRLTGFTDYSLRVLMYVAARPERLATIAEIAASYRISHNHLMKVVFELGRHGLLRTVRGRNGGISLARPADEICIGDVVRFTEAGSAIVECFGADNRCTIVAPCRLKSGLHQAQQAFLAVLDGITLADLVRGNRPLSRALQAA